MKGLIAFAAVAAALTLAGPALGAYPPWVMAIRDCADDGKLQGTYSHGALATALKKVPSDGDEYTDCKNALREAMTGGSGKKDAPPPNGVVTESGAVAASSDDSARLQAVIQAAQADAPAAVAAAIRTPVRDEAFSDLDRAAGPRYAPNLDLLAAVLAAGLLLLSTTTVVRRVHRRPAA